MGQFVAFYITFCGPVMGQQQINFIHEKLGKGIKKNRGELNQKRPTEYPENEDANKNDELISLTGKGKEKGRVYK